MVETNYIYNQIPSSLFRERLDKLDLSDSREVQMLDMIRADEIGYIYHSGLNALEKITECDTVLILIESIGRIIDYVVIDTNDYNRIQKDKGNIIRSGGGMSIIINNIIYPLPRYLMNLYNHQRSIIVRNIDGNNRNNTRRNLTVIVNLK